MDPAGVITDIETIRLNDFQVCQKINLIESQINRLKRTEPMTSIDKDSTHWFRVEAENEQLAIRREQVENVSRQLCLQFDSEIQKLDDEFERHVKRFRQQMGYDEIQKKVAEAHELLTNGREELAQLRQQQAELAQQIEAERHRQRADESAIAEMRSFLGRGRALRQRIARLNVSQNQLQALDKRIAALKAMNAARQGQTPPSTGGNRILQSFQDGNTASRRSCHQASMSPRRVPTVRPCNVSVTPSSVPRAQAGGTQAQLPPVALAVDRSTPSSMLLLEQVPGATKHANTFYESAWEDDLDFVPPSEGRDHRPVYQQQMQSFGGLEDDAVIYID